MIPPTHLEYYVTECVAASLEAIVAYRLFPLIGSPSSKRVNVICPAKSCHESFLGAQKGAHHYPACDWNEKTEREVRSSAATQSGFINGGCRAACIFSEGFVPESARHFQIEIPQIELLRTALLSDPKFHLLSPWQLRVAVVLHVKPNRTAHQGASRAAASLGKAHAQSSGIVACDAEFKSLHETLGRQYWPSDVVGDFSHCISSCIGETHNCDSPPTPLPRETSGRTQFFLEEWVLSFHPLLSNGQQAKFEHRKLCTALKGLMAAIHFLPTHSALLALRGSEKPCGGRGEQRGFQTQQNVYVETRICARWSGQEQKVRHGRVSLSSWIPLVSFKSNLDGADFTQKIFDPSGAVALATRCQEDGFRSTPARSSPTPPMTARSQTMSTQEAARNVHAATGHLTTVFPLGENSGVSDWRQRSGEPDGCFPGSLDFFSVKTASLGRPPYEHQSTAAPKDSGDASVPCVSCQSSVGGRSLSSVTKFDTCETRILWSISTSLGSLECTVTYNEDVAQSIVAAKELDAIDGCVEGFYPVADAYTEKRAGEFPRDEATVLSDTDPWLEMDDPYSAIDLVLPRQELKVGVGLDLSRGVSSESAFNRKDRSWSNKESYGLWHSLLQRASIKCAHHLSSIPAYGLGLRPLLEKYPPRAILRLSASAIAAASSRFGRSEESKGGEPHNALLRTSDRLYGYLPGVTPRRAFIFNRTRTGCSDDESASAFVETGENTPAAEFTHLCDELVPERAEDLGEAFKAEEGLLLGDSVFGSMWLNNASSFSLAGGPSAAESVLLPDPSDTLRGQRFALSHSSVVQRVTDALDSQDAAPVLEALKYLTDSLRVLEQLAGGVLPSALKRSNELRFLEPLFAQMQTVQEGGLQKAGTDLSSLQEQRASGLRERWRYVSQCAAIAAAHQEEAKVFRELCLAELDPNWKPFTGAVQVGQKPNECGYRTLSNSRGKAAMQARLSASFAFYLLNAASGPVQPSDNSHREGLLLQYLNWICADNEGWLGGGKNGELIRPEIEQAATKHDSSQEETCDPWGIQDMLQALKRFEDEESAFLPLGMMGLP